MSNRLEQLKESYPLISDNTDTILSTQQKPFLLLKSTAREHPLSMKKTSERA